MKKIMYAVLGMMLFASCNKEESSEFILEEKVAPQFEVTTAKTTYKVGERVTFNIEGDAGLLHFWSGDIGNHYDYRDGRVTPVPEKVEFSFNMRMHYPNNKGSRIFVLVSTDFDGDRESYDDVSAATWTDITNRCIIDHDAEVGDYVFSGIVDVTDLRVEDKPMYFAFKYMFDPAWGSSGKTMWVRDIVVQTVTGGDVFVLNKDRILREDYPSYSTTSPTKHPLSSDNFGSLLRMTTGTVGTYNGVAYDRTQPNDDYWVSPEYNVWEERDLGPDKPVTVTRIDRPTVSAVTYEAYSTPGVYKVVFVGTDPAMKENNQTVRELEITIVPDDEDN